MKIKSPENRSISGRNFNIMKISRLLLMEFGISLFISCSNDVDNKNNTANGDYSNGFFILNEGGTGQGTVSFSNNDF